MSALDEIPLFPLSSVVLFPRVLTPLHLFEPRYRQMAEHALAGERRIGMIAVPPEHAEGMAEDPELYPVGCAGDIVQHERLSDGRFNIVLTGTRRFRVVEEPARPAGQLFRLARVEWLEDQLAPEEAPRVAALRLQIIERVRDLAGHSDPKRAAEISVQTFEGVDDVTFVNSLSNAIAFATPEKQGLLEAASIAARFERLEGLLSFRLAELASPGTGGAGRVH